MTEATKLEPPYPRVQAAIVRLADWIKRSEERRAAGRELEMLPAAERDAIAHDLGISVEELYAVADKPHDSADLLFRRMAALKIDRAMIEMELPTVMQDLERLCSLCSDRARCIGDLERDNVDPSWRLYCPNSATLGALQDQE